MQSWVLLGCGLASITASLAASAAHYGALGVGAADVRTLAVTETPSPSATTPAPSAPQRVVSASLLSDELLLDVLPWERWAGVSYVVDWATATPAAARFPKTIPRTSGTIEDLLSRRPDLVVVSPYNDAYAFSQLRNLGVAVHVVAAPQNFEQLFASWRALAARVGAPRQAQQTIVQAEQQLRRVRAQARRLKRAPRAVLLQGMYSYGPETLQGACLREAGLSNVLSGVSGALSPQLNTEQIIGLAPELIFLAAEVAVPRPAQPQDLVAMPFLSDIQGAHQAHIQLIPGAWMASISQFSLSACEAYVETATEHYSRSESE